MLRVQSRTVRQWLCWKVPQQTSRVKSVRKWGLLARSQQGTSILVQLKAFCQYVLSDLANIAANGAINGIDRELFVTASSGGIAGERVAQHAAEGFEGQGFAEEKPLV